MAKKEIGKLEKIKSMLGRINILDVDRDEDLVWALSDMWNLEKHINQTLNDLSEKLEKNPDDEYLKLFRLLSQVLTELRVHRTKHLERIEKLKHMGTWCEYKHWVGLMAQMGEVASKDIYMALEKEKILEKTKDEKKRKELENEIKEDWENALKDLRTSKFAHDTIFLLNKFAEKYLKTENK